MRLIELVVFTMMTLHLSWNCRKNTGTHFLNGQGRRMMSKSRCLTRSYSTRNPNERDKYWAMLLHRWTHGRWLVYCISNFTSFLPTFPLAMERATYVTKSFLISLALVKRHLTVEQAAQAAQVEVSSQIQRWGEVEDSKSVVSHLGPQNGD